MNVLGQLFRVITTPVRWLLAVPMWVISSPRRMLGLSLPGRAAVLVFFVLLICTLAAIGVIYNAQGRGAASIGHYLMTPTFGMVVVLVFVIPVVVYYWLRLWLEGDTARFPDIDAAWREGLAALQANGIDIASMPIFLVVGAPDDRLAKSLFRGTGFEWIVKETPMGVHPLRWYANDRAIYLTCLATGRLGKLHQLGRGAEGARQAAPADLRSTMQPAANLRGTMVAGGGGAVRDTSRAMDFGADAPAEPESNALRGTLVPGAAAGGGRSGGNAPVSAGGSSVLSRHDADLESERLHYLCELLHRSRRPVCPMNGVLVLLPFEVIQNVMVAKDIPAAIRSDLETIRESTQLLCPVTALVTGMEQESGFGELVRRVGMSKAKANRFGKGFDVWNAPTAESIDAFSSHACGAFEDWVYNLFRDRDGLNKPGNARLYMLLCKIRSELRARLRNILLHGFSVDPSAKETDDRPFLFNGCYFAATGDTEDRQAFVRNVFEKMLDMEEELEWTPEAWRQDDRYHALSQFGMAIDFGLVVALIGMVVFRYWGKN
ncbi:MAG: type VI secretion protein IcmF/TssM N-terminal domain-containing protein [Pirellulaceae bacterium]